MTTDAAVGDLVRLDAQATARPLTEAQAGMWYAQRLDPANPVFNTAQYIEIAGPFDIAVFSAAVRDAMAEADALAIRVIETGSTSESEGREAGDVGDVSGEPRQVIDEASRAALALTVVDLRGERDPMQAARARMDADLRRPIDPAIDPLAAQVLFVVADDRHLWYQRIHHLAIDGYGTVLLTARICDLYSSRLTGAAPATQPFGQYANVLEADAQYRESARREEDKAWWQQQFAAAPPAPVLAAGPAITAHDYLRTALDFPEGAGAALRHVAETADVPWPDVVTALVAAYIARHGDASGAEPGSASAEVTLGVAAMERLGTPAARVPAMVMNVLPVRIPIDEDQPLAEWLDRVSRALKQARRRGRYRSEQLRRDLGLLGGGRRLHGPLVNVLPFESAPRIAGATASLHVLATGPVDDLTVTIRTDASGEHVRAELDGNPHLYDQDALSVHAARLAAFIGRALTAARVSDVPTLTPAEHTRWVAEVNETAHDVERTTLTELIARAIERTPDAPALVYGTRELSFADLRELGDHLAATLIDRGVRRGDIVGVMLPRSIELVATLYAILRVGAAYLPLDHEQPAARLAPMVGLAQPRCVVADAGSASRLPAGTPTVFLDELLTDARSSAAREDAREAIAAMAPSPGDRAYVIFTSGSTGEPKGVVIEHQAIVNRLEWMRTHYGIVASDRILQKTPYTFDVSVWEFFLPLIAGATLVVAPPGVHKDPRALIDLMREARVSVLHFVPSMLAELLAEPGASSLSPRMVFCSGEALPAALRDRFHATLSGAAGTAGAAAPELHNLYGPTEAAVDVTYWPASAADRSDPVPIGYPVWNTRLYILDDRQRPVPPGVAGHLFLGGVQLAREYVARPDLTQERFIPDPFGAAGDRLYRTGDIARWRADGAVEFLGRSDHQVKIRGQRIELGEIETAVVATGLTSRVVVIAREDVPGDARLVAYVETPAAPTSDSASGAAAQDAVGGVVADGTVDSRLDEIAAAVAMRLPDVMVPAAFVGVTEWPVTSNGKLDRGRLPAPPRASHAAGRAPSTATEQRVAALFASVLHQQPEAIGADGDFFALGGHSLLATQLIRGLRAAFTRELGLGVIFAHPTVARLAAHIDDASRTGGDGLDVLLPLHVPVVSAPATSAVTPAARSASLATSTGAAFGVAASGRTASVGSASADAGSDRGASDRAGLACIHPAGGIAWCYGNLARALRPERPVYGLQARGLRPGAPLPASLDDLAADYAAELRRVQPDGPYHLIGWSVGGIIAQAMAVHLEDAGARVGLLAVLDSYPSDRWRSATDPDEAAALRALLLMAGEEPELVTRSAGAHDLTRSLVVDTLRRGRHPLGALSDDTLSGVLRVVEHNNRLVRRHVHRPCAARMVHFKASLDATAPVTSADEWLRYVGDLYRVDVPFIHAHMTGPDASRLIAPILAEHIR